MGWNKGRRLSIVRQLACVMFLLFAASTANASPTISQQDAVLTTNFSAAATSTAICPAINTTSPINDQLAAVAVEFLQPPASTAGLSYIQTNTVKSLPAIPAAMLMVLTGFLCVSLVRDRRLWLAALAGLLWVGQAGIATLPNLALHLGHRNHIKQQPYAELDYPYYLENSSRLRSDIEGTQYIALLHHLAGIPDDKNAVNLHTSQSAVIFNNNSLTLHLHCLAQIAKQFVCFSPAFIFQNLPRGPPELDLRVVLQISKVYSRNTLMV